MKKTLLALASGLALTTTSWAFELEQQPIKLANPPKVIATYDLAVLDSLNALGIEVKGVPKSNYSGDLAKFKNATEIGTLFEPDYQALKKLKPELIFAGGRSGKVIPELSKLAPVANYTLDSSSFLASYKQVNLNLAKAFAKEKQAQSYIKEVEKTLNNWLKLTKVKQVYFYSLSMVRLWHMQWVTDLAIAMN